MSPAERRREVGLWLGELAWVVGCVLIAWAAMWVLA